MPFPAIALFFAMEISFSQPQVASDGRNYGIVYGSKDTIYFAANGGEPVTVAHAPVLSLGNHRGPRVAYAAGAIVVTAGVGPEGQQYGPNMLRSWRSVDGGKTWPAVPALSTPGTAGIGLQAIASDGKQRLWAAWLGPEEGRVKLWGAHSEDAGATWSKQRVVYESPTGNVCECCHPNVAIAADGTVRILFRNSLAGKRDMYLATSLDNGATFGFEKLGEGSWAIDGCPMDGGGMAELRGEVVTLWRRHSDLYLARPGKAEERIAAGKNAAVALRENGVYAVWSDGEGIMAKGPGKDAWVVSKTGAFPSIAASGPVVVAWEDEGRIRSVRLDR